MDDDDEVLLLWFTMLDKEGETMETKDIKSYAANLRAMGRGLWMGAYDYFQFYDGMMRTIERGFNQAWNEGLKSVGMLPSETTDAERSRLKVEIFNETQYIDGLAQFIEANAKNMGGKLGTVLTRIEGWKAAYDRIQQLAATYAKDDPKMEWVVDAPKESCPDCQRLKGLVKRASYWREHVIPKDWKLSCKSGCLCELQQTDKPLSRGPLPGGF
jgi:hypothetical protein